MVICVSWWFLVVIVDSWWFLVVLGISWFFFVVLGGDYGLIMVFCSFSDCWRSLVVVGGY